MKLKGALLSSLAVLTFAILVFSVVVFAAHTANVTVDKPSVKGGSTNTYTFTVTNSGPDAIFSIITTLPSGFGSPSSITCPSGWGVASTASSVTCLGNPFNPALRIASGSSAHVLFSTTAPIPVSDTNYVWLLETQDNTGNTQTNTDASTTVDVTAPTVNIAGVPETWSNSASTATVTCNDGTGSGCDSSTYKLKTYSSDPGTCPTTYMDYSLSSPQLISSHLWICAAAKDGVNNEGFSSPIEFKIDQVPPTITDDYLYDNIWTNHNQMITLNPQDNGGSGLKEVKYCKGACDPAGGTSLGSPYQLSYSDGINVINYKAWDNANNPSALGTFIVEKDTASPTAGVSGAPAGWQNTDATAAVTCTDQESLSGCDSSAYRLKVYATSPGSCSANPADYTFASPQTISQHSWVCSYAKDVAGNEAFSSSITEFKVDKTSPIGSLTGVPTIWQNTDASIDLACSDNGGSDCSTAKYLTVVPYGTTCTPATYSSAIPASQHSTACWQVADNAGNTASGSSEIKIDKQVPASTIVSPANSAIISSSITQITGTASDTGGSGLNKVEVSIQRSSDNKYWDGSSWIASQTWRLATGTTTWSLAFTPADGTYIALSKATDNANNVETPAAGNTFTYDTVPPTVSISSPVADSVTKGNTITLTSSSSDAVSSPPTCAYQIGSASPVSIGSCNGIVDTLIPGLADGRHTLTLTATDGAGNFNSASVSFVVDTNNILTVGSSGEDFTTIQAAVDKATSGDTISVFAGTYVEDLVISLSKTNLNILGAGATTTTIKGVQNGPATSFPLALPNIEILANGVKIHGFTIESPTYESGKYSSGIVIGAQNVEIYSNSFVTNSGGGSNSDEVSQVLQTYLGVDISGLNVHDNTFTSTEPGAWGYEGIYINPDTGSGPVTIQGNIFTGKILRAITSERSKTTISQNTITTDLVPGLGDFSAPGAHQGINVRNLGVAAQSDVTISQNVVSGSDATKGFNQGIRIGQIGQTLTNFNINGNTLHYNSNGILLKVASGVVVNNNDLSGNTISAKNDDGANTLVATNNYWGTAVASTIASKMSGLVSYTPYYVDPARTILSSIVPTTVYVDDNYIDGSSGSHYFGYDAFNKIQDGVNAVAASGTINVAAGTYTETGQIVINKNLNIIGADKSTVIIKPSADTGNDDSGDAKGWFLVNPGVNFNLQKVTLDGSGKKVTQAIRYKGLGSVSDCIIKNVKYATYLGLGIAAMGNGDVDVTNCEFSNIERIGVIYFGTGITTNSEFKGNTYIGKAVGDWLDYGVEVGGGAKATIKENDISNCKGVASSDESTSAGILVTTYFGAGTTAEIQDNLLHDNTAGIAVGYGTSDTSTVTVNNGNKIYNNDYGIEAQKSPSMSLTVNENQIYSNSIKAIDATNGPAVNAKNNWWGSNQKSTIESKISDLIDFNPWYLDADKTILSSSDTTGPAVVLTNNIDGRAAVKDSDTVIITATFSDVNGLDTGVTPTITIGSLVTNAPMSGSGNVWTYTWNVPVGDTTAAVSISAKDIVGNDAQAPTDVTSYIVDNTAPSVNAGIDQIKNAVFTQTGTASDIGGSGVATYLWTMQSGPKIITFGSSTAASTTVSASVDGTYVIRLTATDNAGNSAYGEFTLTWDIAAPTTSDNAPSGWQTADVTITLTPTDATPSSGIAATMYCTDTVNTCNPSTGTAYTTMPVTISAEGTTYFRYASTDNAGNAQSTVSKTIQIDKTDPTISDNYAFSDVWKNSDQTIALIPDDATSGIAMVKYCTGESCELATGTELATPYPLTFTTDQNTVVRYKAWDNSNLASSIGTFNVKIDKTKPAVDAGADKIKKETFTQEDETASDEGSGIASYLWTQVSGPDGGIITFDTPDAEDTTVQADTDGTYVIRLMVTDNAKNSAYDDFMLTWDTTAPSITTKSPSVNAVGVASNTNVVVTFNEPMECAGGWNTCISLVVNSGGSPITGTATYYPGTYTLTFDPENTLDSNIEYLVTVSDATDLAGNELLSPVSWKFITATFYTVSLKNGWNLVSIPTVPINTAISSVLGGASSSIDAVWTYDAIDDKWHVYRPSPADTSDLSSMTAGYGYWISATGDTAIEGYGSLFKEGQTPPQRQLTSGWNLIGYYQKSGVNEIKANYALSTLADSYCDQTKKWWTSLIGYDNNGKTFNTKAWDEYISPTNAFWIFMKSSTISYMYGPGESTESCEV